MIVKDNIEVNRQLQKITVHNATMS